MEEVIVGRRITRRRLWYGAFVALALVAPLGTLVNIATSSDAALHKDCTHLAGDVILRAPFAQSPFPIYNVTVSSSPDPTFVAGQTVQIHTPTYEPGAQEVRPGRHLSFAVQSYRMHDPATGNTTFQGWRLCDAKAGLFWASQERALGDAAMTLPIFAAAGAWLAFAFDPGRRPGSQPTAVATAVAAGILLAVHAAAVLSRSETALFRAGDDGLAASGTAILLWLLILALAFASALRLRPVGSATLVVSGACLLTLGLAQWLISFRLPLAIVAEPYVAALFGAAAVAGLAAHRNLPRWLPLLFAAVLMLIAAAAFLLTSRYGVAIGIAYGGVPLVLSVVATADAVQRLLSAPTRR